MESQIPQVLLQRLNLEHLTPSQQDEVIAELGGRILKKTLQSLFISLTDEQAIELNESLSQLDESKVMEFLGNNFLDMDDRIASASEEVISQYSTQAVS